MNYNKGKFELFHIWVKGNIKILFQIIWVKGNIDIISNMGER